ncbi:MAG: MlaE family lipid ABC transporter permease subunit [Myxococcota bacterium]|nr:MlaE family lipid ABC transporter permease subunit [Myxococcota bacterium]
MSHSTDRPPLGFSLDRGGGDPLSATVRVQGRLAFVEANALWQRAEELLVSVTTPRLDFDLSDVEAVDGGAMALLVHLRDRLRAAGVASEFIGATKSIQEIVHLYEGDLHLGPRKKRKPERTLAQIGRATIAVFMETQLVLAFFGQMVLAVGGTIRDPRTGNWKDVWPTMERVGADAVPIVVLINFLVGFVMAFQGAVQLKQFGANIFVADLVGLSVTRELGPLMTAIILCGRSGAAFAAELGSMKVSEEVDALQTMGFGPMRYLVLPRALALLLAIPILALLADFVGILGGMVVGLLSLDLTVVGYALETKRALRVWDVYSGIVKSGVFGVAIALIACQQGLATTGGAEGVGRRTTASVVTTFFVLVVLDACFTVLFHAFHL